MKKRCYLPSNCEYKRYGARGIKVCALWMDFDNFYEDMGPKPEGRSLDRIDNDGDYTPENCRWATLHEQNRNKRNNRFITFNGKTQCLQDWAKELGIRADLMWYRLVARKMTMEKAIKA